MQDFGSCHISNPDTQQTLGQINIMDVKSQPNSIPWPPIITVGSIVIAVAAHWLIPINWIAPASAYLWPLGIITIIAALAIDVWAFKTMRNASTTILPTKGADNLVTIGPFAWSRNPIYFANVMLISGIAIAAGSSWMLLAAAAAAYLIGTLAIKREEAHLSARFGRQWHDYAAKVRRWI